MRNTILAIIAWSGAVFGQSTIAKEHSESTQSKNKIVSEKNVESKDRSALNALAKAGVLKHGGNETDTGCTGGGTNCGGVVSQK